MGFAGGSVTFKRLIITGEAPRQVDEALLKQLSNQAAGTGGVRTADHTEIGWSTGDHLLDTRFDFAKNAIADGLYAAMRVDANKPPTDLIRSYQKLNEQAMLEASGRQFLSKPEKREAREQALSRADSEAREGVFRKRKAIPFFWDLKRGEVYLGATSSGAVDQFCLLFTETFDLKASPVTAGELAARYAVRAGEARAFDDCLPIHLINPPSEAELHTPTGHMGETRSRDFLGTEFLTWLWYVCEVESPEIASGLGDTVSVLFEKSLLLDCAYKMTGAVTIAADGPTQLSEASVALAGGKRPVKSGFQMGIHGEAYGFTLRGDEMNFSGVQLPPPQEVADARVVFEDRIDKLRTLIDGVGSLYVVFLKRRFASKWPATLQALRRWVAAGGRGGEPSRPVELGAAS